MSWHILKDCESLPCLQGQEEVSSEAICWDGERFAPSSGPTTLGGYCLPDNETESCLDSRSGMTCRHSMDILGEGESMSSQAGSPARTSAQPAKAQGSTASDPGCGTTWRESFARFDPDSCSWRTPQCSLLEGLDEFSETWPRWGMMRNGACSELSTLAPRTDEIGSGSSELWPTPCLPGNGGSHGKAKMKRLLLPTPLASIATHGGPNQRDSSGRPALQMAAMKWPTPLSGEGSGGGNAGYALAAMNGEKRASGATRSLKLRDAVLAFPTPTVNDSKNSTLPPSQISRDNIPGALIRDGQPPGGQLNPPWVEWLMGWPIGWTDLKPLETDKFRSWRQQHSGF